MKILKVDEYPLTNFEVKQVVEQHFEFRKEKFGVREFNFKRNRDPLLDFECRLLYYFDKQTTVKYQSEETIRNLLKELEPYRLTKLEKMLMVNNPPSSLVEIHSIIDSCESRYNEDDIVKMLEIIKANLLKTPTTSSVSTDISEKKSKKDKKNKAGDRTTWYEFISNIDATRMKKQEAQNKQKEQSKETTSAANKTSKKNDMMDIL
ncbi:hypothetical protein C9374_008830 [Naegleria lovaniensis]|uniref:DNA-directed RNA polymerase III subunit RPC9 n=1 Tax=Naegleria lovaniensis TaxID=51637 RepID=A0AA88GIK7_NAELO|nr:uncharacterized protein C9374_013041 [Naegleria lovaniensis]XP_044545007.1 uncharacterized protein C9374_008830 [Naegleria lovaniensis]KAG2372919.1 hypothetical protein C9374_013041 [Naegleria lovaniensis]KAG2377745.1 hypothetical protein C9374_008830 [Naegleria lovaniensis]